MNTHTKIISTFLVLLFTGNCIFLNGQSYRKIRWGYKPSQPTNTIMAIDVANIEPMPERVKVDVQLTNKNELEPSKFSFYCEYNKKEKQYINNDISFKSYNAGAEYLVTTRLLDAKDNVIGTPETHWVTIADSLEKNIDDPCDIKPNADGTIATSKIDEKGNQNIHFEIPLTFKKGNPTASFLSLHKWTQVSIMHRESSSGYIVNITTSPVFNDKKGYFEINYSLTPQSKTSSWDLVDVQYIVMNPCGDKFYLSSTGPSNHEWGVAIDFKVSKDAPDVCEMPKVDSLYWEIGNQDKTTGKTPIYVHFPMNYSKVGWSKWKIKMLVHDVLQDQYKSTVVVSADASLNEKTGWIEATMYFEKEYKINFNAIELRIANPCNDSIGFTAYLPQFKFTGPGKHTCKCKSGFFDKEKVKIEICNTKFKIKEVDYATSTVSGLYVMQFAIKLDKSSDIPSVMKMAVQLTNCDNKTTFILLTVKYDSKTGIYSADQSIAQDKECPWKLTYAEIGAYNPCKDLTWWDLDFSKLKGNGSGTKNPSSQISAKPQLL